MRVFGRRVGVVLFLLGTGLWGLVGPGLAAGEARVDPPEAPSSARRMLAVQNQRLVASLFEMGFKPSELASVLGNAPAGGVDRDLRPGELCTALVPAPRAGAAGADAAKPARLSLGDCMQTGEVRRRVGIGGASRAGDAAVGDAATLNSDLRSFVAAIPAGEPVADARVSSGFGFRRHPISHRLGAHEGTDFVTSGDRTVRATGDGVVRFADLRGGFGKLVVVEHDYGFETRYAHLATLKVRAGQRVVAGQRLGVMGSTGYSTGVHLHYELRFGERPLDAVKALTLARTAPALFGR